MNSHIKIVLIIYKMTGNKIQIKETIFLFRAYSFLKSTI